MKDNSVSRFDDREFKLVEPNRVIVGSDEGAGRIHIPFIEYEPVPARSIPWNQPLA